MQLDIPSGEFAGFIFDLDGTLVDTMPLHYRAWDQALRRAGLSTPLDEDFFYSLGGVPTRTVAELLGAHYRLAIDADLVYHDKEARFTELQAGAKVIEPVAAIARRLAERYPLAVASGGPREVVRRTLEMTGLAPLFPTVVTPEDVARGKPAPDLFLLAAARMGVPPADCLVFEDAEPGIRAAEAAGMRWVFVPSRRKA
jgi:HAD superfamily hydrolase (TIGR01509 family)